jgi:hypothetical protein
VIALNFEFIQERLAQSLVTVPFGIVPFKEVHIFIERYFVFHVILDSKSCLVFWTPETVVSMAKKEIRGQPEAFLSKKMACLDSYLI